MFNKIRELDTVAKMSIIGGLILLITLIIITFVSCMGNEENDKNNIGVQKGTVNEDAVLKDGTKEYVRSIAMIKENNHQNQQLTILDLETGEEATLTVDGTVTIKDEYGVEMTLAQLEVGNIVETKYDAVTFIPEHVQISAQIWERKNVQDMIVNTDEKTIQLANDIYNYSDELMAMSDGEVLSIENIDPIDKLTVLGYKDTIWVIERQLGHGFIKLLNHKKFVGGTMEIGKKVYDIEEQTRVTVSADVHSVIISKDQYSPYITQVMVEEGGEAVVDLSKVQSDVAIVNFAVSEPDSTLYIDGVIREDYSEPISLEFGEYAIRVEKKNFKSWEGKLLANQDYIDFPIDLSIESIVVNVGGPQGFELMIDTKSYGTIPVLDIPISEGSHTIFIRKEGYYSKSYSIQIQNTGEPYNFMFPELTKISDETIDENGNSDNTDDAHSNGNNKKDGSGGNTEEDINNDINESTSEDVYEND